MRILVTLVVGALVTSLAASSAWALHKKLRTGSATEMSAEELNELTDPFFQFVLKSHPNVRSLKEIAQILMPDGASRKVRLFVVSEAIADRTDTERRFVLGYDGKGPDGKPLAPNVMLSASFSRDEFPDEPALIETWGWDESKGRYNYYSRENSRWLFHGSSDDVNQPQSKQGRCLACHISGGPIMKELSFPWNNWHSSKFSARYLTPAAPTAERWPVVDDDSGVLRTSLESAAALETDFLRPSIIRFNASRIADSVSTVRVVQNAPQLLAPLFRTQEFNIITSTVQSGLHPFSDDNTGKPGQAVPIPDQHFLNSELLAGNHGLTGLEIEEADDFRSVAELKLSPDEYVAAVTASGQKLGTKAGKDTVFAWMVPEASFVDNNLVDQLMKDGVVTREFVAAVLAVDLKQPVLSRARADLLRFVPESYSIATQGSGTSTPATHELTVKTIAALEATNPSPSTPAGLFLARLKSTDPVAALRDDVKDYLLTTKQSVSDPATRSTAINKLYSDAVARRKLVKNEGPFRTITAESDILFPLN